MWKRFKGLRAENTEWFLLTLGKIIFSFYKIQEMDWLSGSVSYYKRRQDHTAVLDYWLLVS
jgi:hypothetical protein